MEHGQKIERETNPRETANFFSLLSFFYTRKLFVKGYKKSLEVEDLYEVPKSCRSKQLGDQLEKQWEIEKEKRKKPSICRALVACYGWSYLVFGIVLFFVKTIITIWYPEALSKLISYFSPGQTTITKRDAAYYAALLIGLNMGNVLFSHNFNILLVEMGIKVRTAVCSLLYRKSFRLSGEALSKITVGKITTIITKDIDSFEMFVLYGNDMWIGITQTAVVSYLIYEKIGMAAVSGISIFIIVLPLQILIGKMSYTFRLQSSKKTDERLEQTQEVLSAIKVIKMYTWEKFFESKVNVSRKEELTKLHKLFYSKVMIVIAGGLCSKIAFFLFLMTYVWMGSDITAEIIYFITGCFSNLEYTMSTLIPIGISYLAEVSATASRVESVLEAKELQLNHTKQNNGKAQIVMKGISTEICGNKILDNVSLVVDKGLNILVGHVGSGKTTFLKAILRECEVNGGEFSITGNVSYASQEPWLFPSSIRSNIIFGEEYCEARYKKILEICALNYDLDTLRDGDYTIIGDHGINLSKGQQARVNLARAVYKECDIYLLDDCLAALDAHVSNYIFRECMQKFLRDKLCIFVTNNYRHIQRADRVLVIDGTSIAYSDKYVVAENGVEDSSASEDEEVVPEESVKLNGLKENGIKDYVVRKNSKVYQETKKGGKVDMEVYSKFFGFGGGLLVFSLVMGIFIVSQATDSSCEKFMSQWVTLVQNVSMYKALNLTNTSAYREVDQKRSNTLYIYSLAVGISTVMTLVKTFAFYNFVRRISINLHKAMINRILNGAMQFFDSNFIGNILNRFAKDLCTIDEYLPFALMECLTMVFVATGGIILLTTINFIFMLQLMTVFVISYFIRHFYQPTGRNLQRIDALSRSPMIGHLNATLEGLATIRASGAEEIIKNEFDNHQNLYTSANYILNCCMAALGFALEMLCSFFIATVAVGFLIVDFETTVGDVGLAITQSLIITGIMTSGLKNLSECENQMTSVERVLEYTEIEEEIKTQGDLPRDWPREGLVKFENVSLSFKNKIRGMLKNVNFVIEPNEKMGIVGRTGAGKSSIISTLFRLYPTKGRILIDGVDIHSVRLDLLRSKISVIPQDPVLFSGNIRNNLDPLRKNQDEEIWKVIQELGLATLIQSLDTEVDKGSNFSAGQKQLVCLARAILNHNKIVVLDEATANVDPATDSLIVEAVKRNFEKCTVIIIAHRVLSVLNCHKVAVLNNGQITELDEPAKLMQDKSSFLHSVIK